MRIQLEKKMKSIAVLSKLVLSFLFHTASASQSGPIKVHFVPHSHMDAGWLRTYDEYYFEEVRHIFDSVIEKLGTRSIYTYTVGDISFFKRYYEELPTSRKNSVKKLVASG